MDIDKDLVRPPPATRRKRPSAIKCVVVLCSLIGLAVVGAIAYFIGKGIYSVYDMARNPHQGMYLNSTTTEPSIFPLIGKEDTFDVYLTVWARVPDAEVSFTAEEEEASRERFGASIETVKKLVRMPERELLVNPTEIVVFSEKMFTGVSRKDRNLHKDVEFEIPLERFHDKLVFSTDIRAAAVLIPHNKWHDQLKDWSGWRPEGAEALSRLDEATLAQLGISGSEAGVLDALSTSFGLVELHDRNYLNRTSDEEEGSHEYFEEDGDDTSIKERMKQWSTYQPHFITKSHVYMVDETRPLNWTQWETRHNNTRRDACGSRLLSAPTRFMCNRDYNSHGEWENLFTLETENGQEKRYGPYIDILHRMAGPRHLIALPVRRGKTYDKETDPKSLTVHHQFTFSSFSPGRKNLLDNFVNPTEVPKNATEHQRIQAHSDWEQWNGVLGNRGKDTHPRTRFILSILDDFIIGFPLAILTTLYWYTRTTSAGLDMPATLLLAFSIMLDQVIAIYKGSRSKTVSWEMFVFVLLLMGFDTAQCVWMFKLALPFEVVWQGWVPAGLRRTRWTKRERATRRLEGKINWTQRGLITITAVALTYAIFHYDFVLVKSLIQIPSDYSDMHPSELSASIVTGSRLTALALQLVMNRHSGTFAGQYALEVYLVAVRRVIKLLEFSPWVMGRYEVRGGVGGVEGILILFEVAWIWQALTLPRVEQSVIEDDE